MVGQGSWSYISLWRKKKSPDILKKNLTYIVMVVPHFIFVLSKKKREEQKEKKTKQTNSKRKKNPSMWGGKSILLLLLSSSELLLDLAQVLVHEGLELVQVPLAGVLLGLLPVAVQVQRGETVYLQRRRRKNKKEMLNLVRSRLQFSRAKTPHH